MVLDFAASAAIRQMQDASSGAKVTIWLIATNERKGCKTKSNFPGFFAFFRGDCFLF